MRRHGIVGLASALLLLTGCGSDSAPSDSGSGERTVREAPVEATVPTEEPTAEEAEDTSVQDYLEEAGITDVMVKRLAAVAEANNYAATVPMDEESAQLFATVIADHCRDVASGKKTWKFYADEDMSTGGTQAQVDAMYGFAEHTFCPSLKPAK